MRLTLLGGLIAPVLSFSVQNFQKPLSQFLLADESVSSVWQAAFEEAPGLEESVNRYLQESSKKVRTRVKTPMDPHFVHTSADHPDYVLRGRQPDPEVLGLDNVTQYSGYIDKILEDKHFFYWFFESRNDPKNDPIVLWINGGPGCSSFLGLLFELGPKKMTINGTLEYNPYSWNSNASVIFLDQPVGAGFSYSNTLSVLDSPVAAKDVFAFLDMFFQQFPEYSHLDFHISGESYAGIYIPLIATEILAHEKKLFELTSILIGNGITNPVVQFQYYEPMLCGQGGYKAVIPPESCAKLAVQTDRCEKLTAACYALGYSKLACVPAFVYCEMAFLDPMRNQKINAYDVRMVCDGEECYPEQALIAKYLNTPEVQAALGAEVEVFEECSESVFLGFILTADQMHPYHEKVAALLDQGLPVLIYAGDKDYICNWLGNRAWTNELEYSHHEEFSSAQVRKFHTPSGKYAGDVQNYGNFTFIRMFDAGHMVPYDQPESAFAVFNDWIGGDYSLGGK